jgi:uncharacterized protein DUF4388
MSDELSIQGTLAETTVPDLLRSLIRGGETGIVSLEAFGRHDNIYVTDGRIVFATSSDPDLGLAEVLFRGGELNLAQVQQAHDSIVGNRRIGSVLVELGYLKPDELMRAVERQVSNIVRNAVSFRSGNYTIEFSGDFPHETLSLSINTERLLMDGVHGVEYWSLIQRGVGRMDRPLRQVPGADTRVFHQDMTEEENHVYGLVSEIATVASISERSYLSNFATCRTLWALLAANLIEDAAQTEIQEQRAAVADELALEAEVEKFNSVFQSIFGIVSQKIGDHIFDFTDRVVLHLSPEVLPYLSGINLMNEGRVDFDQLLNNLIASGSADKPSVVQSVLNELLYGWIYEIRTEFGDRLEPQVAQVVDSLRR